MKSIKEYCSLGALKRASDAAARVAGLSQHQQIQSARMTDNHIQYFQDKKLVHNKKNNPYLTDIIIRIFRILSTNLWICEELEGHLTGFNLILITFENLEFR